VSYFYFFLFYEDDSYFIFRDNPSERTLLGPSSTSSTMTPAACMEFCGPDGYGFAGVEFSQVRISSYFEERD
jgi:hypothetical protein